MKKKDKKDKKKQRKSAARQASSSAAPVAEQPSARTGAQPARGGVPPLDAFDHVKRMPPPSLPGRGPAQTQGSSGAGQPPTKQSPKNIKTTQQSPRAAAEPEQKNPQPPRPPQNPARRRLKRRITAVALVALLIAAGVLLTAKLLFKIEKYAVEGEVPYTEAEIITAFGHETGENIYSFNAKKEAEKLQQSLPYIEKVTIRRRLPSTVVFKLTPAEEKYYLATNEQYVIMNGSRKVLRVADAAPDGLVRIDGVQAAGMVPGFTLEIEDADTTQALDTLLDALEKRGIEDLNWLDIQDTTRLSFRWQGRYTVIVGSKNNIDAKLDYAFLLLTDSTQSGLTEEDRGTLDVSGYPAVPNAVYTPE